MNEKKYIIAHIQIPMEVLPNGKYTSMSDYLSMEFKQCSNFDEYIQNTAQHSKANYNQNFKKMFDGLFTKIDEPDKIIEKEPDKIAEKEPDKIAEKEEVESIIKLFIRPDEILNNKKRSQNTSFKTYKANSHNYTAKTWI